METVSRSEWSSCGGRTCSLAANMGCLHRPTAGCMFPKLIAGPLVLTVIEDATHRLIEHAIALVECPSGAALT